VALLNFGITCASASDDPLIAQLDRVQEEIFVRPAVADEIQQRLMLRRNMEMGASMVT
jgi:hypothetical protein